ncbi:MAG TPA: DNA-3-methyladenine glycosylase [Kofleriaceae bacterium]|nr:DNA-3-methyladenine glycosylase [Kofleriaceae bacterium]
MILRRSFYARPCLEVAEDLIGKWLVHGPLSGRIVETEAYIGVEDQACHARFGQTKRARILFGPPGRAYVFLIYGMYDCFNVVAEAKGRPAAVLIRALEPGPGVENKTDGPGKLCRALAITRAHNDRDLTRGDLHLEDRNSPRGHIVTTPRIGVDYAGEWAARPWRFVDAESRFLSKKLRR